MDDLLPGREVLQDHINDRKALMERLENDDEFRREYMNKNASSFKQDAQQPNTDVQEILNRLRSRKPDSMEPDSMESDSKDIEIPENNEVNFTEFEDKKSKYVIYNYGTINFQS